MGSITLTGLGKIYPGNVRAVSDLNLSIADGEFMVLVGSSGSGKTTALRMIAGLESVDEGEVRLGDQVINRLEPRKRDLAMVFQNYALYPHMTVFENMAFPLQSLKMPRAEIREHVEDAAEILGLTDYLKRKPKALSGGQRQRVAMGRAIVRQPQAFLMDEPLSNLDAKLRMQMRSELTSLQKTLGTTTVYVTHDQVEAMSMGSRIAVMRDGVLQQVGTPQEVYHHPHNLYVATFIGSPGMNLINGSIFMQDGHLLARFGTGTIPVAEAHRQKLEQSHSVDLVIGVRPEALTLAGEREPGISVSVESVEMLGHELLVQFGIETKPVDESSLTTGSGRPDTIAMQVLSQAKLYARLPAASAITAGQRASLTIEPEALHYFDPATGLAVA